MASSTKNHSHSILKNSVVTQWNSILEMIEPILDLEKYITSVLKMLGKFDFCLDIDDKELLIEIQKFLF